MTRLRALMLATLLVFAAHSLFAAGRVECSSLASKRMGGPVSFCAFLPPSYETHRNVRLPVLYMLHGLGDNHETLINSGTWNLVEQLQQQKKIGEFVIITPNAGRSFYLNDKSGKVPYEDFFIREFIPAMEKRFRISKVRSGRAISGISMGGYGALRFAFKYPQMFISVTAHSPALIEHMPKGAGLAGVAAFVGTAFGRPFDSAYWERNTPFVFARTAKLNGLKIYFDCGDQDDYGFERGTTALQKLLDSRKITHEFHIYPGSHSWRYFSEHLPASLEIQSRALGLTK